MTPARAFALAVVSAMAFVAMAGHRLASPGLYYDETHQVPAAFAWLGREQLPHFSLLKIGAVPWLSMPYGAALKSAAFAGLMTGTGAECSVATWRWFGVALVVAGWIAVTAAVGVRWGAVAQLAFAALLLTDTTLLLTTRHDWGPTALAFLLRCAFLVVWLRSPAPAAWAAFVLGAITGLATFEKLSSVVLVAPLALALGGRPRRDVALALLGLGIGALPLAIVNLATWSHGLGFVSLSRLDDPHTTSVARFTRDFLSLGQGDWVRRWVLDLPVARPLVWGEAALIALVALAALERRSRRLALAYLAIGVGLALFPRRTQAHHWIVGTPFQYVAVAALVAANDRWRTPARALLVVLLLVRLPVVAETAHAIATDRTAPRFDPSQNRAAAFLGARADALVVASTWGIANQIVCFAQGRPGAVHEPIYDDQEVERFAGTLAATDRAVLYLAAVPRAAHLFPTRTAGVTAAIERDRRWHEVPVEPDVAGASEVHVRKFVR